MPLDQLSSFATKAQDALSEVWEGAGLPAPEQNEIINQLVTRLLAEIDNTVSSEQKRFEEMRVALPAQRNELTALRQAS